MLPAREEPTRPQGWMHNVQELHLHRLASMNWSPLPGYRKGVWSARFPMFLNNARSSSFSLTPPPILCPRRWCCWAATHPGLSMAILSRY